LCHAIRQHCAEQHWYGSEFQGPQGRYDVAIDDPRRVGFEFEPATEDQLQETEEVLGFPLPPMLRALYSEVANGGFGPACGLRGVLAGAPKTSETLVDWYLSKAEQFTLFNLEGFEIQEDTCITFADSFWPRLLLPICDWGCGVQIGLDSVTGHLLRVGPLEKAYNLTLMATSLEGWLYRWMSGELYGQKLRTSRLSVWSGKPVSLNEDEEVL